jgi:hypothetical protein
LLSILLELRRSDRDMIKKNKIIIGIIMILILAIAGYVGFNQLKNNPKDESIAQGANVDPKKVVWGQQIGSSVEDLAVSIAVDSKGNSCVAGYTSGDIAGKNKGSKDILVSKLDATGKLLWTLQTGTESDDAAKYIVLNSAGEAYITGETNGKFNGESDKGNIFIQKISSDGKLLWTKQYGTEESAKSNTIRMDADENLYISGSTDGKMGDKTFGQSDAFLSKLDKEGTLLWTCQWGTDAGDEIKGIDLDQAGNIFATGDTYGNLAGTNLGGSDIFVSQISPAGKLVFSKQFGTNANDTATKVLVDSDKNLYLTGSTYGDFAATQMGQGDSLLMKLSSTGEMLWKKQFGTALWDGIHGIVLSKEDPKNIIVGGCQNYSECQAFLRKFDSDGKEIWKKEQVPAFSTCGREIGIDDQGYIYQTGGTHGKLFGTKDFEGTESDVFVYKISEK